MSHILFVGLKERWCEYAPHLRAAFRQENLAVELGHDMAERDVDYIIYSPEGGVEIKDFSRFPKLKAIHGTWAGVDKIVQNPTLNVPYARMVDPGMTTAMVAWVTGHVLRYHLDIDRDILCQNTAWRPRTRARPKDMIWTVLGQGALGSAVAHHIASLGFSVRGWGRSVREDTPSVRSFFASSGLKDALSGAHGVVLLLPHTPETENIIDKARLNYLARGAFLINAGRGGLVDDAALISALDCGQLAHATLDVFRTEPLAREHIYWRHPSVSVSPHIAAETDPESGARVIAKNLARAIKGEQMDNLIEPRRGY